MGGTGSRIDNGAGFCDNRLVGNERYEIGDYMKKRHAFTVIIEHEDGGYCALCPELDVASQGDTVEQAKNNLIEAIELFFETASEAEIKERLHDEVFITRLEVAVG